VIGHLAIDRHHAIVEPLELVEDERVAELLSGPGDEVYRVAQGPVVVRDPGPERLPDEVLIEDSLVGQRANELE
jgi:hypothetical protein